MTKSPDNYVGLHKKYHETIKELALVLSPGYKNDSIEEELIALQNKTAILATELEDGAKNLKTKRIREKYEREANDIKIYNQSIMDRLK